MKKIKYAKDYNQFSKKDIKMKNIKLENLKYKWIVDTIIYEDGTKEKF